MFQDALSLVSFIVMGIREDGKRERQREKERRKNRIRRHVWRKKDSNYFPLTDAILNFQQTYKSFIWASTKRLKFLI